MNEQEFQLIIDTQDVFIIDFSFRPSEEEIQLLYQFANAYFSDNNPADSEIIKK
jgi:hypothetical protein